MNEKKTRGAAAPPCCCRCCPHRLPSVLSHWSLVVVVFRWPALLVVVVVAVVIVPLVAVPWVPLVPFRRSCFVVTVLLLWAWAGQCRVVVVVPI